mgnify:CR=1 FL=1
MEPHGIGAERPLEGCRKNVLAGVLLQFPQSFRRTVDTRKFLAATLKDLSAMPLAVEFRHASWANDRVFVELLVVSAAGVTMAAPTT